MFMKLGLEEVKILYPLDPGIYNKRVKFLSINTSSGGIAEILSGINFYPCYVPLDKSLITLSITTENMLSKMRRMLDDESQIIYANLHETKRTNDYVSYGQLYSANIEESIRRIYNYEAWLGLVLDRPQFINKVYGDRKYLVPISQERYFHIKNDFRSNSFEADFSYSNILIEISNDDYSNARDFLISYFGTKIKLVSLTCNVIQYYGSVRKTRITLTIKKEDYKKIYNTDVGLKIVSVYAIYNIKNGDKDYEPLNLITDIYSLKNSNEELALFVGEIKVSNGLTEQIEADITVIRKLANALYNISDSMEIHLELQGSRQTLNNSNLTISLIKPEIIIKLITAYILTFNNSIKSVLESKDLYSAVINFYNTISNGVFDSDGNLIPADIRKFLLT